jgi:hypothetical protein
MKKIILSALLFLGCMNMAHADYWSNGTYYYTCTSYSSYGAWANGHGYSSYSRVDACNIATSYCQAATPVGYWCN